MIFLSELSKETSPYSLAYEFNLNEIRNIDEYSRLFLGYLQIDSYILNNYNISPKSRSYSFSIEPLFILKHHLLSKYEVFFLIERHDNDIMAWTDIEMRITFINEENLFKRSKVKKISYITDSKSLKNYAFGISMIFRHEKNSHPNKNLKNTKVVSPIFYCDNGERKKLIFEDKIKNKLTGVDGILIESLIINNKEIIISLAKDFIYGELLDYKLFIEKDFSKLKNKIQNIMKNNEKYFQKFNLTKPVFESNKNNKMVEDNENNAQKLKDMVFQALKKNELRIGDQIYSLELIKEIISTEKKNNQHNLLPPIFLEIDKELSKNENNE